MLAVNHDGDSDSTAAIAGNLLGAMYGEAAITVTAVGDHPLLAQRPQAIQNCCQRTFLENDPHLL